MKTALIIGASSGIGKELAKLLAEDGHKVIITGRREKLPEEIKATNPDKFVVKVNDVTDLNACETLFPALINEFIEVGI